MTSTHLPVRVAREQTLKPVKALTIFEQVLKEQAVSDLAKEIMTKQVLARERRIWIQEQQQGWVKEHRAQAQEGVTYRYYGQFPKQAGLVSIP